MRTKDELGRRGEALASRYLEEAGFRVIDRNWRCPLGDIDVVAVDGATLVVVEVKTRSANIRLSRSGGPASVWAGPTTTGSDQIWPSMLSWICTAAGNGVSPGQCGAMALNAK